MAFTTIDDSEAYFQTVLYTGNFTDNTAITLPGTNNMQPDLVWLKERDEAEGHRWHDAARGATKYIQSSSSNAEATNADTLKSFNSNGFTLGANNEHNQNTMPYVAFAWKANGAGSSNTDGNTNTTKTSSNTTSGFSIITYDGDGAAATLGHGLGAVPHVIFQKNLDDTENWQVYHHKNTSAPETDYLTLNTTNATGDQSSRWNDTAPTSTLITIGSDSSVSQSGENMFMLAWSEVQGYSSFGSYVGNTETGNAGNYIMTGFRPALVIIKESTSAGSWLIYDSKRASTFNIAEGTTGVNSYLEHTTGTEQGDNPIIFFSNGFQVRDSLNQADGATYIYMAFAEQPMVNSSGVPNNAR